MTGGMVGGRKNPLLCKGRCSGLTNALSLYTQMYKLFAHFVESRQKKLGKDREQLLIDL